MEVVIYVAGVEKEPKNYVYEESTIFYIGDEVCLVNMWWWW